MLDDFSGFEIELSSREKNSLHASDGVKHHHNIAEFVLVRTGNSIVICGGETFSLTAPFLVHYPAGVVHEQINSQSDDYSRYCFSFSPSFLGGRDAPIPNDFFAFELSGTEFARIVEPIRLLHLYFGLENPLHRYKPDMSYSYLTYDDLPEKKREELSKIRLGHLLSLFLFELEPIASAHSKTPPIPKRLAYIREVCAFASDNLAEKLTLNFLADRFFVSRTKLTTDFRRMMNMSFFDYLTMIRISRAKSILINESDPTASIAEKCGFCSSSHLIAAFRKSCGCTPAEFRERYHNVKR